MIDVPSGSERILSDSECDAAPDVPGVTRLWQAAAGRLGWTVEIIDDEYGYLVEVRNGSRRRVLMGGCSPLNDALAARLCEDKHYTTVLLSRAGIPVPRTARCVSPMHYGDAAVNRRAGAEPGLRFVHEHGLPVVVKPNALSHGRGVTVVRDAAALPAAIEATWRLDAIALVQTYVHGQDARLDYLDGAYLAGYGRRGGDPAGGILNLARGARPTVLEEVPDAWHALCSRIGALLQVRHFGVDLRVDERGELTVIEVNASPLLTRLFELGHAETAIAGTMRVLRAIMDLSDEDERRG